MLLCLSASDFRLYDDNGEPMRFVKSISLHIDPSESPTVLMTIERYLVSLDEIGLEVESSDAIVEEIK
jgi:hypothetical protein